MQCRSGQHWLKLILYMRRLLAFLFCLVAASGVISGPASANANANANAILPERQADLRTAIGAADKHPVAIAPVTEAPALASVRQALRTHAAQRGPGAIEVSGKRTSQIFPDAAVSALVAHVQRVGMARGHQATGPPGFGVSAITSKQNLAPAA